MRTRIPFGLCFIAFSIVLFPQKTIPLPELEKPEYLRVAADYLYVVEESGVIRIVSIGGGKIVRSFGKKGEGPGEFPTTPQVKIQNDVLYASARGKISRFTLQGELRDEITTPVQAFKNRMEPAGSGWLVQKFGPLDEKKPQDFYMGIDLYDGNFQKSKRLHTETIGVMGQKINLIPPLISFCSDHDRIYIAEGYKGLVIQVVDLQGNPLTLIDRPYEKKRVDEEDKRKRLDELGEKLDMSQFIFPEYLPAMKRFIVDDGRILIQTWIRRGNDESEFILLDAKGNELKRLFLPDADSRFTFYGDQYFFLKENSKTEEWELKIIPLSPGPGK